MDRRKTIKQIAEICRAAIAQHDTGANLGAEILDLLDRTNDEEATAADLAVYGKLEGLELDRPVVFFDLETTSDKTDEAMIIEVGALKLFPDGREPVAFRSLVCPGVLIVPEIQELTGITNEDLATAPPWSRVGRAFFEFIQGADLAGYGIHNFDRIILWNEFFRIGIAWEAEECVVMDVGNLVKKANPRSLTDAVREYVNQEHEGAHRAIADATATLEVAAALLVRHPEFRGRFLDLARASAMDRRLDLAGKILLDENGVAVYAIGDLKGKPVQQYPELGRWMLGKAFSEQTKAVIRKLLADVPEVPRASRKTR